MNNWSVSAAIAVGLVASNGQAALAKESVPLSMQGVWARHGHCDVLAERLAIKSHIAGWGRGPYSRIYYSPESAAIFWDEEGVVDNFVAGRRPETLVHNTQGFDMPGKVELVRCGRHLTQVPGRP